ncbi:MAG TPA: TonB-dependent receptor [Pyrinomonadaceae bacterium]|nr:TonB-dependent receptor [Pyrinomonadaceae bacterium]
MIISKKLACLFALSLIIGFAGIVNAQVTTGTISGSVADPSGALVQGATVTATNVDTNSSRSTTSDSDGHFAFTLLPPGRYRVDVTSSGFQSYQAEAVVNITQTTTLDVRLGVTGATATVDVAAETPVIQAESSQSGRVIEGQTIRQMPLSTRNFQQLLVLQAGAQASVPNSTDLGRGDTAFSVNGQRTTSNSVKINGVDANSIGTNSTPNLAVPSTESLQEFIVQTSLYDASNGRNAGGNVEAVTRSGGNDFHGNAFYFLRNKALNANEPFIKARGLERPILTRNQFGGTLGGRIVRDKAFFFASYQGTRERNGLSLSNSLSFPAVPAGLRDDNRTAAGLAATFGLPLVSINPVAVNILNARLPGGGFAIPSSGIAGAAGAAARLPTQVVQSGVSRFREDQFNANVDFNFTNTHSLSSKLFYAENPSFQAIYNFAGTGNRLEGQPVNQLIGFGGDIPITQILYSLTDNYTFNSNITNQARFGINSIEATSTPEEPFTAAQFGMTTPFASIWPGAPTIQVAGVDSSFFFGTSPLGDQHSKIDAYTFQDTVSIIHGKHRIRAGGEFRHSTLDFFFNAFTRGQLVFTSFNNFLLGSGVSILGSGIFDRHYTVKDFGGFVQDDYKLNDRLTLNLGVRYDFFGPPVDSQGRLVNFIPAQFRVGVPPNGIVQAEGGQLAGVPTVDETLVPTDKNNFAPRVGFAYRADDDGKVVVRGGYGIYYDRFSTRFINTQLFNFPYLGLGVGLPGITRTLADPFVPLPQPSTFPTAATIPSVLSPLAPFVGVPVSGVFVDPNIRTPYVQQYNLGVQWEFMKNTVLELGYVGNKGTKLLQVIHLNQPNYVAATNSFVPPLAAGNILAINKNVTGGVHQIQSSSNSSYNSLQMTLTRRYAQGLQMTAAYTYGRSHDYYNGTPVNELASPAGDQSNWRLNYGRSDFNREHRLVISGVYDLPKSKYESGVARALLNNWQVAGIAVFQTGLPFSIIDNPGNAVFSRANFNPNFVGQIQCSGDVSNCLNNYFAQGAFVTSRPRLDGTSVGVVNNPTFVPDAPFGNTPRNFLTGPGQKNVDVSLIKFIPFTERFRGEVRAEFFNVFNWVNYANPVNNIAIGSFGRIISASTGPRVVQFAFKLNF